MFDVGRKLRFRYKLIATTAWINSWIFFRDNKRVFSFFHLKLELLRPFDGILLHLFAEISEIFLDFIPPLLLFLLSYHFHLFILSTSVHVFLFSKLSLDLFSLIFHFYLSLELISDALFLIFLIEICLFILFISFNNKMELIFGSVL